MCIMKEAKEKLKQDDRKELKAQDLRIGNLLMERNGHVITVSSIASDNTISIIDVQGEHQGCFSVNIFNPIELTEDWLIKFGFEDKEVFDSLIYKTISVDIPPYYENELHISKGDCLISSMFNDTRKYIVISEVKYVHQLQNIYRALTGKELTL